jgi:hypothetical protein
MKTRTQRTVPTGFQADIWIRCVFAVFLEEIGGSNLAETFVLICAVVRNATGLEGRGVGVRFPAGARDFYLLRNGRPALGPTQPPIQWVPGALIPA